jgi:hypothetical protein
MQTNAPATGEWVDQFNRAVQFGQVNIDQAITVPAHASTHAVGGSDPVSAASIGAAAVTHASTHSSGGSDPISLTGIGAAPYASAGARILAVWSNVELMSSLYANLGTPKDVNGNNFSIPAGSRAVIDYTYAIIRSTSGTVSTGPQTRIYIGGITLDATTTAVVTNRLTSTSQTFGTTTIVAGYTYHFANAAAAPGIGFAAASSVPQLAISTAGTGGGSYKVDYFASFVVLPAAV